MFHIFEKIFLSDTFFEYFIYFLFSAIFSGNLDKLAQDLLACKKLEYVLFMFIIGLK
jgi:hypothetical protein